MKESHSSRTGGGGGGGEGLNDEKPQSTATLAKTFRTLRKRLSRTSTSNKSDQPSPRKSSQFDNTGKSGGDDSEASSIGDDGTQLTFAEISSTDSDLKVEENPMAVSLKVHRSLPAQNTPSIITSPPPSSPDSNEKINDSECSYENAHLSKTWSSSTFTGAQLRGTCSLEYTEHMKEKSHKRKAHMIDLRKDDHQQQISPNTITSTSKHSISTSLTSYHSYTLTLFNTKGALT